MARRSSAPRRSLPRRPAPKKPAPAPASAQKTQTPAPQQTPHAAPQAGGSMLGSFVGNALSFAAGHVIGQGVSRMLWGDSTGKSEEEIIEREQKLMNECEDNVKAFNDCIEKYNEDISKCQFYFNELNACKQQKVDPYFEQA